MKIELIGAIVLLIFSNNLFCETITEPTKISNTIPFVINKVSTPSAHEANESYRSVNHGINPTDASQPEIKSIPTSDLQKFVLQVREAICGSIGDADFKVWISVATSAEGNIHLVGVSASANSGLEVTVHCKQRKSRRNTR